MIDMISRHRPRIEGDREDEILDATVAVLIELGYDRLTMDAVAAAAKASKATLYRRWSSKAVLVCDAISRAKGCPTPEMVDTGSLRGDLIEMSCNQGGVTDDVPMSVVAGLLTALHRDDDLKQAFHEVFLPPRLDATRTVYQRAAERGELGPDVDVELLAMVLPAVSIHQSFILGIDVDREFVTRVVDNVILPAARGRRGTGTGEGPVPEHEA